jgi:hypothetical protein
VRPWLLALAAVLCVPSLVSAHPAPSVDANNRYVKITPMADRARLAYTIYFGEVPGNFARKGLDRDNDWLVSDDEVAGWAASLGETVRGALDVRLDGKDVAITWESVTPGLGSARVDGGAFAVDLVAWMCARTPGPRHELELVDSHSLMPPGETEVRVDESPGIRLDVARVGETPFVDRVARFQGDAAPLSRGLHLTWLAGAGAEPPPDQRCPRPPAPGARKGWLVPLVLGTVALAGILWALARARARARAR